ncbi:hypothetical protein FSST1_012906 [Fusarium sambucinum]
MLCGKIGTGWRVVAIINTIAVFLFTISGALLVFWGCQKPRSLSKHFIFFEGSCKTSKSVNTWLHLLLNACSTGILASSNFFMQLLSSRTRSEVDKAHRANRALKIGVQSLRNVFWTSKVKFICWILFFVSSFPLHLFFNSAIFSTEYLGADWHLTIASEGFVDGAKFWGSGAALWPPQHGDELEGYGSPGNVDDYFKSSSTTFEKIQNASRQAKNWKRMDVSDCIFQYVFCNPRVDLGDVVMVVESQNETFMENNTVGWTRDNLLKPFKSKEDQSYWNQRIPSQETNSLWFAADCRTNVSPEDNRAGNCTQTCGKAVGKGNMTSTTIRPGAVPYTYTMDFFRNTSRDDSWPGLVNETAGSLKLKYCLAKEISQNCKVGVSNQLLLIVVVSIAVKGFLCVVVLFLLPKEQPLAVLGDAIESFIQFPDEFTIDRCLLDRDIEEDMGAGHQFVMTAAPARQSWTSAIQRETWARSYGVMSMNIFLLAGGFIAAQMNAPITGLSLVQSMNNGILSASKASAGKIIDSVLRANLPQLLLSITYFIYNNIYTYLCAEKEWNSYGGRYQLLRVSQPKGQQRSTTYRLQLPYRYSIPLIIVSIFMHWLVSRAIYVFLAEGDYYELGQMDAESSNIGVDLSGSGLSEDAFVGVGYSTLTILLLLITSIILPFIPTLLGGRKVKTQMPLAGASSVVMSAACHVPILQDNMRYGVQEGNMKKDQWVATEENEDAICLSEMSVTNERQELLALTDSHISEIDQRSCSDPSYLEDGLTLDGQSFLRDVTQNPVRWGVVKTSASWKEKHANTSSSNGTVGHLSFGTELHEVTDPIPGQWYI